MRVDIKSEILVVVVGCHAEKELCVQKGKSDAWAGFNKTFWLRVDDPLSMIVSNLDALLSINDPSYCISSIQDGLLVTPLLDPAAADPTACIEYIPSSYVVKCRL